jgi:hypothetical protein
MPFIVFGTIILASGIFLFLRGVKKHNIEMRNGAFGWTLAGFFLLIWGLLIMLTGKI